MFERFDIRGSLFQIVVESLGALGCRGIIPPEVLVHEGVHVDVGIPQKLCEQPLVQRPRAPQTRRCVHVVEVAGAGAVVPRDVRRQNTRVDHLERFDAAAVIVLANEPPFSQYEENSGFPE